MAERRELPVALVAATEDQPGARAALLAALGAGPSHAYLFRGPRGSGKAAAARAFAAELLAAGSADPESARSRALAEPPAHPDLVWIRPAGAWHLVDELRAEVIRAASLRPVESERRVFVIEAAEAMREESQNALLKTLEEPAPFAHLILLCSEPELLLATIVSRCQPVVFSPLAPEAVVARLAGADRSQQPSTEEEAAARLCDGDVGVARLLLSDAGRELRGSAEAAVRATRAEQRGEPAWRPLLEEAEGAGRRAGAETERRLGELVARRSGKLPRDAAEQARRVERRARTESLDLALALCGAWFRDLATVLEGAPALALNQDRLDALRSDADGLAPQRPREAVELILDTRRRLRLNVSEELALEALWYRLGAIMY